jgi:1,2-phenylacetyl-CoA epoxidase catalytic subunit
MTSKKTAMSLTAQIAKHFREIHFGENWTVSNLREHLADVTWQQATTQVPNLNTIAALTFHINYFVAAALVVLEGGKLNSKDAYSFDHPPIQNQEDWQNMLDKMWADAGRFALLVEQLPESKLWETFEDERYGNYYRNIHGIIEHSHYHLGQIVLIKKMLTQTDHS